MKVLIIEDEENLARQLKQMLLELDEDINIIKTIPSVVGTVQYFNQNGEADLIFADIYLNDGLSFDIFQQVGCPAPIVFCTAYDQYAIKAFQLDSVDYLLKPIRKEDLQKAVTKYKRLFENANGNFQRNQSLQRLEQKLLGQKNYRNNFLLSYRDRLVPVGIEEISHFLADYGLIKCVTFDQRIYAMEQSLDAIAEELDPLQFFRANRQYLVNRKSILEVEFYFNGRLFLNLHPKPADAVIISKARATEFKHWMNSG